MKIHSDDLNHNQDQIDASQLKSAASVKQDNDSAGESSQAKSQAKSQAQTAPQSPPSVPRLMMKSVADLILFAGFLCLGATVLAFAAQYHFVLELMTHFRLQYMAILIWAVGVAAVRKYWRTAGVLNLALVLNAYLVAGLLEKPGQPEGDGDALRVMQMNVLTSNQDHDRLIKYVREQQPDVAVFQEVNQVWLEALQKGLPKWHRVAESPREDNFGIAVFMRPECQWEDQFVRVIDSTAGVPMVDFVLAASSSDSDNQVRILAVHTLPPMSLAYSKAHHEHIDEVIDWANAKQDMPAMVIGDLNATRWSVGMKKIFKQTELIDSTEGFGPQGTWPATLKLSGMIGIDHVLITDDFRVENKVIGEDVGSDHLPVLVDLVLPAN